MQNNPLKKEWQYGLLFSVLAVVSALISGLWSWSILLWALIYILWKWVEVYYFYKWYSEDANADKIPLSTGIFEQLISHVIHNKKQNGKFLKKNKLLIKQFESMAQALPYATLLLNKKFEIQWANDASHSILGIIQSQDKDSKIDNLIRDPLFITLLKDKNIEEIRINHPNDTLRKIHIKLVKLTNSRYLLVARDISEQESLRKSRKAFVDNASHELRTPLTVITGYLEMLHNSGEISSQWQTAIKQAMQQSKRMENIINDMLKLSGMEHERYLEDNDENINMPTLLNRLLNDVKNSSTAKTHTFKANIDSGLHIKGNQEEITSVVLNLLNNAVIHTQKNTEISLKWFKQKDKAMLWICDNGTGIEPKHLTHLTERFYRVDNSRDKNTNSTGLGLAIVKQICDNHNATLSIESELQKGTCFKIEFPESRIV
jgi:two-component system phosphate regulon sensor histidine kinase PhoR